jgi:hypothetical protein
MIVASLLACPPQNLPKPVPPAPIPATGYDPPPPDHHPVVGTSSGTGSGTGSVGVSGASNGAACTASTECASGLCEGQGCGAGQGRCVARDRSCTFDIQAYCGCDGTTFDASGSCPERRYQHRGACKASGSATAGPLPAGAACLVGTECDSGVCEGIGCGDAAPGVCASKSRKCVRFNRAYCGCDGVTFSASGSCPGRRYAAIGGCPTR